MRAILPVLVALSVAGPGPRELLAQTDQPPVFRSGVEVMEVDVTVVDSRGMPVRDLRAPDFTDKRRGLRHGIAMAGDATSTQEDDPFADEHRQIRFVRQQIDHQAAAALRVRQLMR